MTESAETPEATESRPDVDLHLRASVPPEEEGGIPGWAKIAVVFFLLAGAVAFLLFGNTESDPFVYSKLVNEVVPTPGEFAERELRVEGDLRNGSVKFREEPCEWRFVLEKEGEVMPVRFPQCVVPDTFRDGMGISVTVQGRLQADGSFDANTVVPRCPSKYEMQQRQQAGEAMPHELPAQPSPEST